MEPGSATPVPNPGQRALGTPEGVGSNGSSMDLSGPPGKPESRSNTIGDTVGQTRPAATRQFDASPVELPPERRLSAPRLAGLAAAAGVAAIILGGWAFASSVRAEGTGSVAPSTPAPAGFDEAVDLLAAPDAERLRLRGAVGRIILVVRPTGSAALVLNGLGPAGSGWAYQAWVSRPNAITPRSAALFSGREPVVPLTVPVARGAVVAVTLEPEVGSFAPTRTPKLHVERPA